ncbi:MAG TPA: glucose-6-phosphate dehydrogenase [Gemmataceae bacterium]|nr:glucose-6-phosphate dehydrogenase [Gemmataceae bacterium]
MAPEPLQSDAMVFFGASGDLAYKKIFPTLQSMVRRGRLNVPIIGVANTPWTLEQFRARAKESIQTHGKFDDAVFAKLSTLLQYIAGDYTDPATFKQLCTAIDGAKRPLFYLAIPPSLFATVAKGIATVCQPEHARLVLEKPFGRDLGSAKVLNHTLHQWFPEPSIFRIDHYLGKEPVQNLIYFRFANPFLLAGWNHRHIESVQITMAEAFDVKGRGKFYEEVGAIRDVVQNHMLQTVACLAMDCPHDNSHEALRDARGELLQKIRPLNTQSVVRGQYRGYKQEPGVAADSRVETFAAIRFDIDNERWTGVPFFVRVGKCLPITATEVIVRFQPIAHPVLDEAQLPGANYFRFRLGPEEVIAIGTRVKKPGERMVGESAELVAHHQPPDEMEPYERLLGDAAMGDATLFAREDSVEAAWRIVNPILNDKSVPIEYEPGTWGPSDRLTPPGGWQNPEIEK